MAAFVAATMLGVAAGWPLLFIDPAAVFHSTATFVAGSTEGRGAAYFGKIYQKTEFPWHYSTVYLWLATPVLVSTAALAGAVMLWRTDRSAFAVLSAWLLVPLAALSIPGTSRYDGMRHLFVAVPAMLVFSAVGLRGAASLLPLNSEPARRWGEAAVVGAVLLWSLREVREVYPRYDIYMNEAARRAYGSQLKNHFDLLPWHR
jgi:hypothetical protein